MTKDPSVQSREMAEQARDPEWRGGSFLRELFMGRVCPELLDSGGHIGELQRPEFLSFCHRLKNVLRDEVDPASIDQSGEYPRQIIDRLAELGAFGMTIPRKYGGLGLSHREYSRAMQLVGSYDANLTALLSAHQAIGVPRPVEMFGSEALKRKYLPRCARGAISAFALTEPAVGSDPARLGTLGRKVLDPAPHFLLDGLKLWCTNGTLAELIVVLARDPATDKINALLVETAWPGVRVEQRCHFMGLRALANGLISFEGVRVPFDNLIGQEGKGLKIALATLNTGRLTLPAATAGAAKLALQTSRKWASVREQWGTSIGRHDAVAQQLTRMVATTYAMECVAEIVASLADRSDRDVRLEVAAAKEWNTTRGWEVTDSALQLRGGRGYENETSLAARGEPAVPLERMLRDSRVNRIFEGSSEIMHLFIAREALDKHLEVAGILLQRSASLGRKLRALPRIVLFHIGWYARLWLRYDGWPRYRRYGALAVHLRYMARSSRRLARSTFYAMLRHGRRLERRQAILFRVVDIALELFALGATVVRAAGRRTADPDAYELTDCLAREVRCRVKRLFHDLRHNDDTANYDIAQHLLAGQYKWLERGIVGLSYTAEQLRPQTVREYIRAREAQRAKPPSTPVQVEHPAQP